MNLPSSGIRRALSIGAVWGTLWLAFWLVCATIIGILDPDSIDPGETSGMLAIFGPMGFFSGVAFACLRFASLQSSKAADLPLLRTAGLGVIGTAIVQLPYLGHGDQGLLPNLFMAFLFSLIGGIATLVWHQTTRLWSRFRPVPGPS
jgi:hypothetical protein